MAKRKRGDGKSRQLELSAGRQVKTGLIRGMTFGVKAVQYSVVDGLAMFEGDIVLGTEAEMDAQTAQLREVASGAVAMGVVITGAQYRWPNCTIPYDIDASLPNQARVTGAIQHWETNTRYRFVLRTAANAAQYPDWVTFRPSSGCSSSVGRRGGQQFVNLAAGCTMGNTIHEIGHVVGLWHEQSRQDRDTFVTIHWDKIQAGMQHNFDQHITDGDDVGAYDYGSIMHYPRAAFSIDGSDTITPVSATAVIGQRTALSAGDIAAADSLCPVVKRPDTLKEVPKDVRTDTLKEMTKDVKLDTRKELVKDIWLDTKKEVIFDTKKEIPKDKLKDVALDPITRPGRPDPGPLRPLTGPAPFTVATSHRAPAAGDTELADQAVQLDAHLAALADALAEADMAHEALQQQYDEVAALLRQTLDAADPAGGA